MRLSSASSAAASPSAGRPRIVLAPDGFKGSLSSGEVAAALREGILSTCPEADVRTVPGPPVFHPGLNR